MQHVGRQVGDFKLWRHIIEILPCLSGSMLLSENLQDLLDLLPESRWGQLQWLASNILQTIDGDLCRPLRLVDFLRHHCLHVNSAEKLGTDASVVMRTPVYLDVDGERSIPNLRVLCVREVVSPFHWGPLPLKIGARALGFRKVAHDTAAVVEIHHPFEEGGIVLRVLTSSWNGASDTNCRANSTGNCARSKGASH